MLTFIADDILCDTTFLSKFIKRF